MDKIRSWPRWIRYGLISALVALTLTIPFFISNKSFLFIGPLAPAGFLILLGGPDLGTPILFIAETALFWFLVGSLIGRYVKSGSRAVGCWLCILILTWIGLFVVFSML